LSKQTNNSLSLQKAFQISSGYTRKRAIKLWIVAQLLIPQRRRKYGYLCFSYLKWVDDFIDNPGRSKDEKLEFIENQLKLITALSNGEERKIETDEEFFLYYIIQYAQEINNSNLILEVKNSVESIAMDAGRLNYNGIFYDIELNKYLDKVVRPVFNLTYYFLHPFVKIPQNNEYIGKFVWKVLILRDFFEDVDSGYINISKEDIEKYNLGVYNLKKNVNRLRWMRDKYPECMAILEEDIEIFKSMPLKIKLFWYPIYPYMIYELIKIKIYGYNFGEIRKINFIRELQVFSLTFLLSLKTIIKVFF
jgi:phytoene/squalene synthetase